MITQEKKIPFRPRKDFIVSGAHLYNLIHAIRMGARFLKCDCVHEYIHFLEKTRAADVKQYKKLLAYMQDMQEGLKTHTTTAAVSTRRVLLLYINKLKSFIINNFSE